MMNDPKNPELFADQLSNWLRENTLDIASIETESDHGHEFQYVILEKSTLEYFIKEFLKRGY